MTAPLRQVAPLIEIKGLRREFPAGDEVLAVLKDIDLTIEAGEMVAIVGQSGSGKSTLMNILGCLDRPTAGSYRVAGRDTSQLEPDELSQLRREYFGFIFQRYHLLGDLTAQGNVEVPAIYAGRDRATRRRQSHALLERLGMGDRLGHRPGQLSGGQQQRVSIARALVNGGQVILADEPTGALDSKSGEEVLKVLGDLHADGHTIILVTHDMAVAAHADRIIEIRDGEIVDDRRTRNEVRVPPVLAAPGPGAVGFEALRDRFVEAFHMAVIAMNAHRLRTFLTMLGIIIGIASVVSVVALGNGSKQQVLSNISALGTNRIDIFPGTGFADRRASAIRTLSPSDADAIAAQVYVDSVTPSVQTNSTLRYRNLSATAQVQGVGDQFFRVRGMTVAKGAFFEKDAIPSLAQVAVIDQNTMKTLFADGTDPIGQVILLGAVPVRIVGVANATQTMGMGGDSLNIWSPYTTVMSRLLGQNYLRSITVRVKDDVPMTAAGDALKKLLTQRHGAEDVYVSNTDEIRETITKTTGTMTVLIAAIAVISLIVGGIGVMNIMLVSVTERTREIGVRVAVGARQGDILQQFLIEAVLVCLIGGALGVVLAMAVGVGFKLFSTSFTLIYSPMSVFAAFACSTLIGVVFGFLPARSAARLDPVEALARE